MSTEQCVIRNTNTGRRYCTIPKAFEKGCQSHTSAAVAVRCPSLAPRVERDAHLRRARSRPSLLLFSPSLFLTFLFGCCLHVSVRSCGARLSLLPLDAPRGAQPLSPSLLSSFLMYYFRARRARPSRLPVALCSSLRSRRCTCDNNRESSPATFPCCRSLATPLIKH